MENIATDVKNYTPIRGELWKQAKGFSANYFVSNKGRILTTTHHGGKSAAIMKPAPSVDHRHLPLTRYGYRNGRRFLRGV